MRRTNLLAVVALAALSASATAQLNHAWTRYLNGPTNQSDGASTCVTDVDGNVYVAGSTAMDGSGINADFILAKYTPTGDLVWTQMLNGAGNSQDILSDMVVRDGFVYVSGRIMQPTNWYSDSDLAVAKLNAETGQFVWTRTFSGEFTPGIESSVDGANTLAVDNAGNVFVVGFTWEWSYYFSNSDYCTVKYSPSGDQLWFRKYHGGATYVAISDQPYFAATDDEGNLVITGDSPGPNNASEIATIKYNGANGDVMWMNRSGSIDVALRGVPRSMQIAQDGDILVLAATFNNFIGVIRFAKDTGDVRWWWNQRVGHFGYRDAFNLMPNGDPVFGVIYDPDFDDSNLNNNARFIRLNGDTGQTMWSYSYGTSVFGDFQRPKAVEPTPEGNILFIGHGSPVPYQNRDQIWQFSGTGALTFTDFFQATPASIFESKTLVRDGFGAYFVCGQAIGLSENGDITVAKFTPPGESLPPVSIRSVEGSLSGTRQDVYFEDGLWASVNARRGSMRASMEVESQSMYAQATSLRVDLQARSLGADSVATVHARNVATGQWVPLGKFKSGAETSTFSAQITSNAAQYLNANRKVLLRVTWQREGGFPNFAGWSGKLDVVRWVATQ